MTNLDRRPSAYPAPRFTTVELTWIEKKIEHWIRFGRSTEGQVVDASHSIVRYTPGSIFAVVRWASNDYGTISSRIDILRATAEGDDYTRVPFVRPGADILLRIYSWPKVARVLEMIDRIEAAGIDPAEVSPAYWGHLNNRIAAGHEPRRYSRMRHLAWTLRQSLMP